MRTGSRRFLLYPGYRNVFSCTSCEMSRVESEEHRCVDCLSYACIHLVRVREYGAVCFCCVDYPEGNWPDWCFTMLPTDGGEK